MSKITKATFKSFINKNRANLLFMQKSDFDGMTDAVQQNRDARLRPAISADQTDQVYTQHNLGIRGLWLVGQGRDYFTPFDGNHYTGIEYTNSCGSGIVAIERTK